MKIPICRLQRIVLRIIVGFFCAASFLICAEELQAQGQPNITTTSLPNGTIGVEYVQTLAATGGIRPYTWSVIQGALPTGLSLSASFGEIGGTPTTSGTFAFRVRVTTILGQTDDAALSITINYPPPVVSTASLPAGTVGTPYSQTLAATNGNPPLAWSISSGSLPAGLGLNGATIVGTPTSAGTSNFNVRVTDSINRTNQR